MHTIRLLLSQHKLGLGTFTTAGFSNLVAAAPIDKEAERSLILSLVHDLNNLYATDLCEDPVVNRYLDEDKFYNDIYKKQQLILIGTSHLNRVTDRLDCDKWAVNNLCRPGFCITEESVAEITGQVEELGKKFS
jgi:hypothetical protein